MKVSHFKHLFCGKFAIAVVLTASCLAPFLSPKPLESFGLRLHAPLVDGINGVFLWCSDSQVGRVATGRVISAGAVVKEEHSFGDCASMQFPRETMSVNLEIPDTEQSVSGRQFPSFPNPASVELFIYEVPEALFWSAPALLDGLEQSSPLPIWKPSSGSPLRHAMLIILERSAKEEMVGITTRRIVALVADEESGCNWSMCYNPRESVCGNLSAVNRGSSVPSFRKRTCEQPATGRFFDNARPESFLVLDGWNHG